MPQQFLKMNRLGKIAGAIATSPFSPELSTCCQFAQRNYTCKLRRLHKHHFADDKNKLTEAIERGFISLTRPGQARHAFDDCVYPILV